MSTTSHLLRANLHAHSRRYIATGVAIIISLVFVTVALNFAYGMAERVQRQAAGIFDGAHVVVVDDSGSSDLKALAADLAHTSGVAQAEPVFTSYVSFESSSGSFTEQVVNLLPRPFEQAEVLEGALPQASNEVLLSESLALSLDLHVGDTVSMKPDFTDERTVDMKVVGISPSGFIGRLTSFVSSDAFTALGIPHEVPRLLVTGDSSVGASEEGNSALAAVVSGVSSAQGTKVFSYEEMIAQVNEESSKTFAPMLLGMLAFPAIAGVVALIVVHSTFQVILHQRKREMALLRAIGARSSQLRTMSVAETLTVGAFSSACAVVLGCILSALALWQAELAAGFVAAFALISPLPMVAIFAVGTLLTCFVGIRPVLGAARVSPMAALSPIEDSPIRSQRLPRVRLSVASVVLLVCLGGMFYLVNWISPELRFIGLVGLSFVSLIAALVIVSAALPYMTRTLGKVSSSMLMQMARENTARHPRRTAATGSAIIIGVTLMVTMMVGASSLKATLSGELDYRRPLDFEVSLASDSVVSDVEAAIATVPNVASTLPVRTVVASVNGNDDILVAGQPNLSSVLHSEKDLLSTGELSGYFTEDLEVGSVVKVTGKNGVTVDFIASHQPAYISADVVVPDADIDKLGAAKPTLILVKISDASQAQVTAAKLAEVEGVIGVNGSAIERAMYTQLIGNILNVVLALIAISVLVAVVGVSNTLTLSVRERTRENGLLRALGLTRKQMRRLLTYEAGLIAVASVLIGMALGIFYAWIGMLALPMEVQHIHMDLPVWQLGGVLVGALLLAVFASAGPGNRAARISPVEALA